MAEVAEKAGDEKERPRGVAATIWALERTQDLVSVVVGVLLAVLAVVVLVLGVVVFFRDVTTGPARLARADRFTYRPRTRPPPPGRHAHADWPPPTLSSVPLT
jgi:hypothetical protein